MPKGLANKQHTGEIKQQVVEYMKENGLFCVETARRFETDHKNATLWEHIYLTHEVEGLYLERHGRGENGKPSKPSASKWKKI